ncbi:MAG: permease for cytosine/purine, uracil, thiamine, allantoin family protein [Gammaproteobacteria bacterium]|nr:permease for cytosine/purine, uracil, thiamine, allantoin family protein [Gammaproteobacteria bacterium]
MASPILIEVRSIDYVPLAERHGKVWHLSPIWFTGDVNLASLAVGATGIALHINFLWTAIAIVTGCAVGSFFMAFHSTQGPQLGLPQMIQSRPQFGYMGALLVWGVALVTYVGYNALNHLLIGETVHQVIGITPHAVLVPFCILAIALALVGYDWIHLAQRWLAYVLIVALLAFTVGAFVTFKLPVDEFSLEHFALTPFLAQFFAAAAYQLSWSIYVSDYSRYLPPDVGVRASFWWTFIGVMLGGVWTMLVGAVAAALYPEASITEAVQAAGDAIFPGLGVIVLVGAALGLVTITALNFYGASLTLLSIIDSFKSLRSTLSKRIVTLVALGLGTLAIAFHSSGDFVKAYDGLLAVLLYLFTPWTAINLIDFYVVRKGHYSVREIFNPRGMYGRWNWRGLTAYGVGFISMIPFFSTSIYIGPVAAALKGADVSMFVGLPVSAAFYLWACRSLDIAGERRQAIAADRGLESDQPLASVGELILTEREA